MTYRNDFTLPAELLEQVAEQGLDVLPELIRIIINAAMQAERSEYLQAEPYQHTPERTGHANGYKPKTLRTRMGDITFAVPQVREGGFYPQALEKGLRSERALTLGLAEMYVQGVSTRKVKAITEQLCGLNINSSAVSQAASQLDSELAKWRERRRMSQLALAVEAEISSRHLSFVETGRSRPSQEMVLLLAEVLDVPPRACNDLLAAAGYAPMYRETSLDAPEMAGFQRALDFLLRQQEPYPAIVLDRYWNILLGNEGTGRFIQLFMAPAAVDALGSPNGLRLICHPEGLRPYIVNWESTAAALIQWLHRDLLRSADLGQQLLLDELLAYPDVPRNWRTLDLDAPTAPFLTIEMQKGDTHLKFFTTLTTLGTPYDITLHELRIESFFPADESTDLALRRLHAGG